MNAIVDAALGRSRTVLMILILVLVAGSVAVVTIPKESEPDIDVPYLYISVSHEGISPEDAERLLVRPLENELRAIEGLVEMTSTASEGYASVILEFEATHDVDIAMADTREKVDTAKTELPDDSDEPSILEVGPTQEPVVIVTLYGDASMRTLIALARDLQDRIEGIPGVLEADLAGDREELLEVIVDPLALESYNIDPAELVQAVDLNNRLVAAGTLDTGAGRFSVKVPGLFETAQDVMTLPVKVSGEGVVTLGDVATIRRTFKDAESYARLNGQPAIALEVKKRVGSNIIDVIETVRGTVEASRATWPGGIKVAYTQDKSEDIAVMLSDLQNNVISAVLLVMIVILAALGFRSALLVGLAIPGSFLMAILVLAAMGLTINIVVLFSLILAVGMLVDGAIVVTEFADRKMQEGHARRIAYAQAAKRMAWPIAASTATTLAAFMPLLFWPDVTGQFMRYLPITLIAVLAASFAMAIVFVPTVGSLIGRPSEGNARTLAALAAAESGDVRALPGFTGWYARQLSWISANIWRPLILLFGAFGLLIVTTMAYGIYGNGVEFFPDVEPEEAEVIVHARGNLSTDEKDMLMREVEARVLAFDGFDAAYTRVGAFGTGSDYAEDTIGVIRLQFMDWQERRSSRDILNDIRAATQNLAGVYVETDVPDAGPPQGKDVQIELRSDIPELIDPIVDLVRGHFDAQPDLIDVEDTRPLPGIEWEVRVDRSQAGRFGANVATVGQMVQLVTNGVLAGEYRPDDVDEEVDIRVRFPHGERDILQLDQLRLQSPSGLVPISTFVERAPIPATGSLSRVDSQRVITVKANVIDAVQPTAKVNELKAWIAEQAIDPRVEVVFRGADEDQQQSTVFLEKAFLVALFIMAIILVTQFNSFYHAFLILSAVILSTIGVLLGMLATGQPFGVVMTGVGVISLAGIVVNNNIVLIDTYQHLIRSGMEPIEAVVRTGAQRLRPVLLTTVTTVCGLLPMVFQTNLDFVTRDVAVGAPSTQWWVQLSTAVVSGLTFATVLTLGLTPALLALGAHVGTRLKGRRDEGAIPAAAE